LTTTLTAVRKK